MDEAWLAAVPPFVVATVLLLVPGLVVRMAGWNARSLTPYLLVPALSTAIVAVSSNLASVVGLPWSLIPVAAVTVGAALAAFIVRRWIGPDEPPRPPYRAVVALTAGVVLAAVVVSLQLMFVFGAPGNVSQTFDNIVHLNAIRLTLDAADASSFAVGRTSDIGFYPNAWHSFVTLAEQTTGAGIPVSVNATNVAIGAIAWPTSVMALASALFRERTAALISSAALATGFGAFPILLLDFGVLYPNATAYAILPASIAAVVLLLRTEVGRPMIRAGFVLLVVCAGIGLSHPNAFLALYAFGAPLALFVLGREAWRHRERRTWIVTGSGAAVLLLGFVVLWRFGRTDAALARWAAWQGTAQAFGEAALVSPRALPITVPLTVLLLVGLVTIVRRPTRWMFVALPFAAASFMFVLSAGLPSGTFIRDLVTNPWYNDSFRLAALLPVAGIPVATLVALMLVDGAARVRGHLRVPRLLASTIAVVAAIAFFAVGMGPNVSAAAVQAREAYALTEDSALLTVDEMALLDRLPSTVPEDALIIANPWTGASLAFALAEREVVERHVFGVRSADEQYLDENLAQIDSDPGVCAAIDRVGATYALDFGSRNVFTSDASGLDQRGLNDLRPSDHLVLVDSEGSDARLFRIEGC